MVRMTCLDLPSGIERSFTEKQYKEFITIEEFSKYINSTGKTCVDPTDAMAQKAECLTHFTYERSKKNLMLVNIQGSGFDLFDPEIVSTDLQRVLMGLPNYQLTTRFSANCQLTTNFSYLLTFIISQR